MNSKQKAALFTALANVLRMIGFLITARFRTCGVGLILPALCLVCARPAEAYTEIVRNTSAGTVSWRDEVTYIIEAYLDKTDGGSSYEHTDAYDGALYYSVSGGSVSYSGDIHYSSTYGMAIHEVEVSNSSGSSQTYTIRCYGDLGSDSSTRWHYVDVDGPYYTVSSDQSSASSDGYDPVVSLLYGDNAINSYGTSRSLPYTQNNDDHNFYVYNVSIANGVTHRYLFLGGVGDIDDNTYNRASEAYSAVSLLVDPANWPEDFTSFLTAGEKQEVINWSLDSKQSQTITFSQIEDQYRTNTLHLSASASSGLEVSFNVESGPATITGNTNVTFSGVGTVSIVASQDGDEDWSAAPSITNTFDVTESLFVRTSDGNAITWTNNSGTIFVDPQIVVSGTHPGPLDATVEISSGQQTGDTLAGGGGTFDSERGILTITNATDIADIQSKLRQVTFGTTSHDMSNREIAFTVGGELGGGSLLYNGHYYEFVTDADIHWADAEAAAEARSHAGLDGYLAVVTSQGENDFIAGKLSGQGWMGAGDPDVEGTWKWLTGPEAGTQFWQGDEYGSSVGGMYENWAGGEPNDYASSEDYAHFYENGTWNDYAYDNGSIEGYVVEYGGTGFGGEAGDIDAADTKIIEVRSESFTVLRSRAQGDGVALDLESREDKTYHIYKRDGSLSAGRSLLQSDTATGTSLTLLDSNLVNEASVRFYEIVEDDDGTRRTNSAVYAAYVTPTETGQWYRLSMPVDMGASNTLDSTLGEKLRSGVSGDALAGDMLYVLDSSGSWLQYVLDDSDTWQTFPGGEDATDEITTTQAFWIKRRSTGSSSNAVYTGLIVTEGTPITFPSDTWQLIAWPFPTPRREDAESNGWGFAAAGAQTGTSWLTADNFWVDGALLWLHTDGRWRRANGSSAGDIELGPLGGYYYLHRGDGFTWTPEEE